MNLEELRDQLKASSLDIIKKRYNYLRGVITKENDFMDMINDINKFENEEVINFNKEFDKTFDEAFGIKK